MGNAMSGLFVFSSNPPQGGFPFLFLCPIQHVTPIPLCPSSSQFLSSYANSTFCQRLISFVPVSKMLCSFLILFFSPLQPPSPQVPFLQCSFLNSVSCHPDYFFHYKIFPIYLTISVASFSCPDISRLYTPLTFPVTRLSCFVTYLNLYSPFILPHCQVHISYQSIHILFLLLYLPGKEKN